MKVILLDIEGTTTDINFVHQELFPYAAQRMGPFLSEQAETPAVAQALAQVAEETGAQGLEALTQVLLDWTQQDRKAGPLKQLQGLIWEQGYQKGELKGHVYADVRPAFERWSAQGLRLAIYSSGSVLAQKLIFGHSSAGDLCPYLSAYFDTAVGGKKEAASYTQIALQLNQPPAEILFLSDIPAELAAAQAAGLQVTELRRDGAEPDGAYPWAADFTGLG
ncbi:MAG: acireductone synthase [bacterium]|nr:acireductone synthase [bacterium]